MDGNDGCTPMWMSLMHKTTLKMVPVIISLSIIYKFLKKKKNTYCMTQTNLYIDRKQISGGLGMWDGEIWKRKIIKRVKKIL